MASPTNVRLGCKGLPGTNTLAYFENPQITVVKSFVLLALGAFVIMDHIKCISFGQALAFHANIRLGRKRLPVTNTLTFYTHSEIMNMKSFTTLGPVPNVIKLFTAANLRIFVISQSGCFWQAFPALSNVCRKAYPREVHFNCYTQG